MENLRPWQRALTALAYLKVLIGVGLYVAAFAHPEQPTPRHFLMATHVVAYGMAAAVLIVVGRRDLRATVLGVAFLLTAAVFADNAPQAVTISNTPVSVVVGTVFALQVDAFTSFFLWFFVLEFPRVARFGPHYQLPRLVMRWSLMVGVVLFSLNVAYFAMTLGGSSSPLYVVFRLFARENKQGLYWPVQYAFSLAAFGAMIWKARVAPITEHRRVSLLATGLVAGTSPTILYVLLTTVWPGFAVLVPLRYAGWVLYPMLLSTPFTTAYAVLVHQALNARLVIRRALQYAFARYSVLGVVTLPVFILLGLVYRQRDRSLIELLAGRNGLQFVALLLLALAAWRGGRGLIERLDRRFFREQYDARHILGQLVERCRVASSRLELAESLRLEIDRALHPVSTGVLFLRPDREYMTSPTDDARPLPVNSFLAQALDRSDPVIEVDLERGAGLVRSLPTEDRYWLADAGVRLLLPLRQGPGRVAGLIWLGEKRSELPYSGEDRQLLSTVSAAAALSMGSLGVQQGPQAPV